MFTGDCLTSLLLTYSLITAIPLLAANSVPDKCNALPLFVVITSLLLTGVKIIPSILGRQSFLVCGNKIHHVKLDWRGY